MIRDSDWPAADRWPTDHSSYLVRRDAHEIYIPWQP